MGVRAAVFDVRGKAAWGSAAHGFGPQLSERTFRALVVSLNQDNPFRQVYETGGHVDTNLELLKRNRNVLERFKPSPAYPILLLPIRSAGSVSAIFYADPGGKPGGLPVEALKILTEFAGAQLDRLMALSGGVPSAEGVGVEAEPVVEPSVELPVEAQAPALIVEPVGQAEAAVAAPAAPLEPAPVELPPVEPPPVELPPVELPPVEPAPVVAEPLPPPAPVVEPPVAAVAPPEAPSPAGFDLSQLSEAEQKIHKDAKRFAKLLVSEIDLYNKAKVADGRKNKDLYKRLKSDIDRSRQTFEKRFGKTLAGQFDYLHEELVRTLAASDPSVLGSDYPGPTA